MWIIGIITEEECKDEQNVRSRPSGRNSERVYTRGHDRDGDRFEAGDLARGAVPHSQWKIGDIGGNGDPDRSFDRNNARIMARQSAEVGSLAGRTTTFSAGDCTADTRFLNSASIGVRTTVRNSEGAIPDKEIRRPISSSSPTSISLYRPTVIRIPGRKIPGMFLSPNSPYFFSPDECPSRSQGRLCRFFIKRFDSHTSSFPTIREFVFRKPDRPGRQPVSRRPGFRAP